MEFDNLNILHLPFLRIRLNKSNSQIFKLIWQVPAFLFQIFSEYRALKKLLLKQHIDIVISDNCYGLWNRKVYSIFITHQLFIKLPKKIRLMEKPINHFNHWFISKFDTCWIPDFEDDSALAGELSHLKILKSNMVYIGPLSRFYHPKYQLVESIERKSKQILFIISGPEIQRTVFETIIKTEIELLKKEYTCIVVRGLPVNTDNDLPTGWYNHVSGNELENFILQSEFIVCRPGYSTVMDLTALGRTAIVVPTPGQTEQEYLVKYLGSKGLFCCQYQDKINILSGIEILKTGQKEFTIPKYHSELLENILEKPPFKE